jgi:hypothetical protein
VTPQEFTRHITHALDQSTRNMDAATLARLASMRRKVVRGDVRHAGYGVLTQVQHHPWLGLAVAAGLLLAGWFVLQQGQLSELGETDILLLTDDLPPNAYAEKAFTQWLKSQGN